MIAPLKTFIIYSSRDRSLRDDFLEHLQPLVRAGKIRVWSDRDIPPGEPWNDEIREKLEETELFIPLVSKSFFVSEYITTVELPFAEERRQAGMAFLIPVWLNHCVYKDDPIIGSLEVIPKDTPITSHKWENTDAAWSHVVQKISSRVDQIRNAPDFQDRRTDAAAWRSAQSADTVEALEAYLSDPRHRLHRREAEERLEALRKAPKPKPPGGPLPIRVAGISSAPQEVPVPDVEAARQDSVAWGEARLSDTEAAYRGYLSRFPQGRFAGDAEAALRRWEAVESPSPRPDMVFVRGGTFDMGDVMGDGEADDETVHRVTVADFYIGRTEVTFEEYDRFCEATGRDKPDDQGWGRGKRPVINVSWYDAIEYCNWLSAQHGLTPYYAIDKTRKDPNNTSGLDDLKWMVTPNRRANGYRLPTEAEWEYAAREGGRKVRFGHGKDLIDPREINFDARAGYKKPYSVVGEYRGRTVPVGSLNSPNALGLHDMSGNVWEWCWDWYGSYSGGAEDNPQGAGQGSCRVFRGGSWGSRPRSCRAAHRHSWNPTYRNSDVGFRLARS